MHEYAKYHRLGNSSLTAEFWFVIFVEFPSRAWKLELKMSIGEADQTSQK
jgi:hypothetical protein